MERREEAICKPDIPTPPELSWAAPGDCLGRRSFIIRSRSSMVSLRMLASAIRMVSEIDVFSIARAHHR